MKSLHPAEVRAEPAAVAGVAFLDAAGSRRCVWPVSGSGAMMVVCGEQRSEGKSYCDDHLSRSSSGLPPGRLRP